MSFTGPWQISSSIHWHHIHMYVCVLHYTRTYIHTNTHSHVPTSEISRQDYWSNPCQYYSQGLYKLFVEHPCVSHCCASATLHCWYTCVYMYIYIYIHMYIFICVCMYMYMYVCIHINIYLYIYIYYVYINIYIYIWIYISRCIYIYI